MRKNMKMIFCIAAMFLQLCSTCFAESIAFELYKVERDGSRVLLEAGRKEYSPAEMVVHPEFRQGAFYGVSKEIELANGFSVGTLDTYESPKTGFGLWVNKLPVGSDPNGFSWEWFSQGSDGKFKRLQGRAPISVETKMHSSTQEELLRVEFEADVEMDYKENICCANPSEYPTHVLVIKSGSVLAFPSVSPNKVVKPFAALTRTLSTPHLLAHGFAIVAGSVAPS